VKIDDPKSPLTAAFGGKHFVYQDEFFRFPVGPYSRDKLHVLLSIDVEKTDMNSGSPCAQPCNRADNDYAISWIRKYGEACFLYPWHNPTLFTTPPLRRAFSGWNPVYPGRSGGHHAQREAGGAEIAMKRRWR
jgi:hypothetical protein